MSTNEPSSIVSVQEILNYLVDKNGLCKICGKDHRFKPTFEHVRTSIDVIPELLLTKSIFEAA
jgi:hypothetical protein